MLHYKKFTKSQAREFIEEIDNLSDAVYEDLLAQWSTFNVIGYDESYNELRKKVIDIYCKYKEKGGYEVDVRIGLCLYTKGF